MAKRKSLFSELTPTRLVEPCERAPVPVAKRQFKRFRYLYVMYRLLRLGGGNLLLRLGGRRTVKKREQRIVKCLQCLGMLWIRVAQALSLRGAGLATGLGLTLMDLRGRGGFYPLEHIRRIIEKERGLPLEEMFEDFDETPFAASTVSQHHRARLKKEQTWVAVKVQQPQAEDIFNRDLALFRTMIWFMKAFSIRTGMRWSQLYHELKEIKLRELNYHYEATALETLEKNLTGQPVHVPRLFPRYCGERVLVMEFVQGALLSDLICMRRDHPERAEEWLKTNNVNLKDVAHRLFRSVYRQVFEDNFFHGDMHTGNIILLRDGHIAFIECRSAGSLEVESLGKQRMFLKSLVEQEYVTAAEIYFLLASRLPRVDLNTVKEKLVREWRIWETRAYISELPYEQKSFAYMTGQVNRVVYDSQFAALWSFTRLTCAWVHLDNALAALWPRLNYIQQLKIYFRASDRRETITKLGNLPTRIGASMAALHELPKRFEEYVLFQETLMRRQAQVVQGSASKLDAVMAAGFGFGGFMTVLTGVFFLLVFLLRSQGASVQMFLGDQLAWLADRVPVMELGTWLVLFTAFAVLYAFFRVQEKRFSREEFGGPPP